MFWMILASIFTAYVVTTAVVFRFPTLLFRKLSPTPFPFFRIGHRGGAGEYVENTLSAFVEVKRVGHVDAIELDVRLTADGKVVVFHDANLGRLAGRNTAIADVNYQDLPKIGGKPIALLSEVFGEPSLAEVPINLDVKPERNLERSLELLTKTLELIRLHKRENLIVWGSASEEISKHCFAAAPEIRRFFSAKRILLIYVAYWFGFLAWLPIREHYIELPWIDWIFEEWLDLSVARRPFLMKTLWKVLRFLFLQRFLFAHLNRRGVGVIWWTLNSEDHFTPALKLACQGIMTDYPSRLTEFLANDHRNTSN